MFLTRVTGLPSHIGMPTFSAAVSMRSAGAAASSLRRRPVNRMMGAATPRPSPWQDGRGVQKPRRPADPYSTAAGRACSASCFARV